MIRRLKACLKWLFDFILFIIVILLFAAVMAAGLLYMQEAMMSAVDGACYTNLAGEFICKVK